jgi:hypothetical protein
MLFKEVITVYSENHSKPINIIRWKSAEELTVKAAATGPESVKELELNF